MPKCRVCGAAHAACGPPTIGTVIPVDERVTLRKGDGSMADLKRYNVEVPRRNGPPATTVLLLSDEDAKAAGLSDKDLAGKAAPANKAAAAPANTAAPKPANKAAGPKRSTPAKGTVKKPAQKPGAQPPAA